MATPNVFQSFVNTVIADALSAGGSPLLNFLSAFGAAAGDPAKITAAFVAFEGAELGALPSFEAVLSQQIAAALTARVQAAIASPPKV